MRNSLLFTCSLSIVLFSLPALYAQGNGAGMDDDILIEAGIYEPEVDEDAEDGEQEREEIDLPSAGTLFSTSTGSTNRIVNAPWGGINSGGRISAPITGSVSRTAPREWTVRVTNSSEDEYSVSLELVQYRTAGPRVTSDNFSYTLKPGQSVDRQVRAHINATEVDLNINRWSRREMPADPDSDEEENS